MCSAVLVDAIADADLPPGTVAFLPGPGAVVGDEIAGHPGVAAVAFVGSTQTGLSVAGGRRDDRWSLPVLRAELHGRRARAGRGPHHRRRS